MALLPSSKKGSVKKDIYRNNGEELARTLYKTLSYPSMKDFKWVIRYIDVAMKIWGKNIAELKGKTTQIKTHPVTRDYVKVPKELLKLHKGVFLKTEIFFVKNIPFFLTLSRVVIKESEL
jgi:hypothetical protein